MEKKYLEAIAILPLMGKTKVVFDDIKNLTQTNDQLIFDDKDGHYEFHKIEDLWHEVNNNAPDIKDVKVMGRRTAKRHNLVDSGRTEVAAGEWQKKDREQRFEYDTGRVLARFFGLDPGEGIPEDDGDDGLRNN